jgi:hypothetical protein
MTRQMMTREVQVMAVDSRMILIKMILSKKLKDDTRYQRMYG